MTYQGAGVLIVHRSSAGGWEVLLGERRIRPFQGWWSIPGGRKERHDIDFRTAALRETAEELCHHRPVPHFFGDCLPQPFDLFGLAEHVHWTPLRNEWHTFLLPLTARVEPARLSVPNAEFDRAAWWPVTHLPERTHPGVLDSVRYFGLV
jgi:8-oxo-dGTP pyrophosphatase MutT (NUDIX family)